MAINLIKGQNVVLNMNLFNVGLGWDVMENSMSDEDFDLDVAAFMLGADKKLISDNYLVFYNSDKRVLPSNLKVIVPSSNWPSTEDGKKQMRHESRPVDPDISVIGSLDDEDGSTSEDGDDETMDINLSKMNPAVQEIVICVSIYDYEARKRNFGQVERAYVRLYKPGQADGEGEYIYDLSEDFSTCASVEFCRLYRRNGEWKIQALGIGHRGGLEELVAKFQ